MRRIVSPAVLTLAAIAASAVPYAREAMLATNGSSSMAGMPMPMGAAADAIPAAVAQLAIAAKVALAALGILGLAVWLFARDRPAAAAGRTPAVSTTLIMGAALAVGLAAFDACTRFHGGGLDATGACHCWLTGVLAGGGALLTGLTIAFGRAVAAWASELARVIVALVVRLVPNRIDPAVIARRFVPPARRSTPLVARRLAGRAPPLFA